MKRNEQAESDLERIIMTAYKEEMMTFIKLDDKYFLEAIKLSLTSKQPYAWRAAWLVHSCLEENDNRVKPYIPEFIQNLKGKPEGHMRELMKILYLVDLDEDQEGELFNHCISTWEQLGHRPAVRYVAFKHILKIAQKHLDLLPEILLLAQEQYTESLSPGIKHSIQKMIKAVNNKL